MVDYTFATEQDGVYTFEQQQSRQAPSKNRIQKSRKETRRRTRANTQGFFKDVAPYSFGPRKLKAARPGRSAATQQPVQPQIPAGPSPHPGLAPPFVQSLHPVESHHTIAPPSDQSPQIEEHQRPGTIPPPTESPSAEASQHQELMLSSQPQAEEFQDLPANSQAEEWRRRPGLEPPSSLRAPRSQHSPQATPQQHEPGPQPLVRPEPATRLPPQQIPDTRLDPPRHPGLEPPRLRKRLATEVDFKQHVRKEQEPQHRRKVRRMNPGNSDTDEEPGLAPRTDAPGLVPPMQEAGSNNPDNGPAPPAGDADAPYSDPDEEL